MGLLNQEFL